MEAVDREENEREIVGRKNGGFEASHLTALILLAATIGAAPLVMRRFGFAAFVADSCLAGGAWLLLRNRAMPFRRAVVVAVLLRLLVMAWPPALSNDVYRYWWDGKVFASGHNPYAFAPDDPRLAALHDAHHARINHPGFRTIYPPLAQILFLAIHTPWLWRLLILACDLAVLWLLRSRPDLVTACATFPPLIFEGAWSGHIEPVAALLLLVAWRYGSGLAAGAAAGLKIVPLAAIPALLVRSQSRVRFAVACASILLLPFVPFMILGDVMPGFHEYARRWIFNAPLFESVFALYVQLDLAAHLKDVWTAIKDPLGLEGVSGFVYRQLYDDFLARATMGVIAAAVIAILVRRRAAVSSSVATLLLCAPALHPWYWIAIVPLAFAEDAAVWIALALCGPFSYLLYDGWPRWGVALLCYALPVFIVKFQTSASAPSAVRSPSGAIPARTARDTSPS